MKYLELTFHLTPTDEAACDVLAALLAGSGCETFLPSPTGQTAYIQQASYDETAICDAVEDFQSIFPNTSISFTCAEAPDENWNREWESAHTFEPIHLPDGQKLTIIPRQAFGSGEHATTRMMLHLLATQELRGSTVIDAGCGTGVLGIAALKLGARTVFAYDIDEWSVRNAKENFLLNGLSTSPTPAIIALGDACTALPSAPIAELLLANINRNILLADLPAFCAHLSAGGHLLLSGFLQADIAPITVAANALGLQLRQTLEDGEWRALAFQKPVPEATN